MRRQSVFVTILLMFYATQVSSANIAWVCQREPGDKIIWSCVADSSHSTGPKAVPKEPEVILEEPLSETRFGEAGQDYPPPSKLPARNSALSVWLDNIPRQNHLIQFGAFQSLANATLLVESALLSQDLRIIPLLSKGTVTYVVISERSFIRKDGLAVAESFFDNNLNISFWLRTPQSLANPVILN
ncbi:MAG: hypothetical protein HOM90_02415 [Porticoccaceae bacterium]|jgi:hypothetical protein|nr:hypothetical protein [Porticoccaceae bacterium]MBT3798109.1 hypothetical protein [Porticoccaceae bacterium]MBT4164897.1 hypothetical protein [Porticoccaceae bacterium]MBT4212424.1 hypothetical protein [Porticoccaceae bacterium]MBT4592356.1 hypothetical protein [Porticoccaceae bacterium]